MNDTILHLPHVPEAPLPEAQLTAPLPRPRDPTTADEATFPAPHDLSEALEPLISAAIARKARQRRYTP